jgi:hypothetical protein
MITSSYNSDGKGYERRECMRCHRNRICCQHHLMRRANSDEVVWLCSNGGEVFYINPCHQFCHEHIAEAIKEGFYKKTDAVYRPHKRKKWVLTKKITII